MADQLTTLGMDNPMSNTPTEKRKNAAVSTAPLSRRYEILEQIGRGGMGHVYRAMDRLEGRWVALKRVIRPMKGSADNLSTAAGLDTRFLLAIEFQALASLWHPHIIRVLDYGFDADQQPYFTMELLDEAQSITQAARGLSVDQKLDLVLQMFQALLYLHRHNIIHRDLKPSNVLVVNQQVKLLDFGLSISSESAAAMRGMIGTLAYMPPEVLHDEPPSAASDLYAAGIMTYEMFAEHHPFDTFDVEDLIAQIEYLEPKVDIPQIPAGLQRILYRLLAKSPRDRYQTPLEVIEALCEAFGKPRMQETLATRESFLQAAKFVGRELEMTRLTAALEQMLDDHGSAWLIAGPGGIGKSRLLAELRTRALIRGAYGLRSQTASENAAPYQVWLPIIRWLAISVTLTDLEVSVLKDVMADIAALIGRAVTDAPELDPRSAQTRFFFTLEGLLMRVNQPLLIMLEDIHNAGTESIALLAWLMRLAPNLPLMFICSYRDDEHPTLHQSISGAQVLRLGPLAPTNIDDLSRSMLGPAGEQPELRALLLKHTDGNAFFLVEVVRALAEEAGGLDNVAEMTIPRYIFQGGLDQIITRRLNQVPPEDQPLLEIAAVTGRILDPDLLRALADGIDVEAWLGRCASVTVLQFQEGQWRFAHDKLREKLLATLTPERRQALHRRAAQALTRMTVSAAVLSYHWAQAGDEGREQHYAALAGDEALRIGANLEAVAFLKRAIALDKGQSDAAKQRRAHWYITTGTAYFGLGKLNDSADAHRTALALLGFPEPKGKGRLILRIAQQFAVQVGHRLRRLKGAATMRAEANTRLIEAARAYREITEIYYFTNNMIPNITAMLSALNIAERAMPSSQLAQSYAAMAVLSGLMGQHGMARRYSRLALETAQKLNDPLAVAHTRQRVSVYLMGIGAWEAAQKDFEAGIQLFDQIGERPARGLSLGALSAALKFQGNLQAALHHAQDLYAEAAHRGDMLLQANGISGVMALSVRLGEWAVFEKAAQTAQALLQKQYNPNIDLRANALQGLYYLRLEQYAQARNYGERALALAQTISPAVYTTAEGFTALPEIFCWLLEHAIADKQQVREALKMLNKFARRFPFAQTTALLYEGTLHWLAGDPKAQQTALTLWQKSIDLCQQLKMPFEEALAHFEIGRQLPMENPARGTHLELAHALFSRIGAQFEAQRVDKLHA